MKKLLSALLGVFIVLPLSAESVRLKSGVIMNGSIVGQSEYTLNLATSYGVIMLSQKEIVEILPDKHRVLLKGGGEIVGTIEDINEFNVRVKTDEGAVNIDVPKIASIEIYDYGQAEKQKAYAEQKQKEAEEALLPKAAPAPGALTFDDSLEKAFSTKNPTLDEMPVERVVRRNADGQIISDTVPVAAAVVAAPSTPVVAAPVKVPSANITQTSSGLKVYTDSLPKDAKFNDGIGTAKEKSVQGAVVSNLAEGKNARRYFALGLGAMVQDLTYKAKAEDGSTAENAQGYDVGGASARVVAQHFWRIGNSNFWVGPELGLAMMPKNSFTEDTVKTDTSGYAADLSVAANYFFVDNAKYRPYITASAGFQSMKLDMKSLDSAVDGGTYKNKDVSSSGFLGGVGVGIERKVADLNLGLEAKIYTAPRADELKDSSSLFYSLMLKASWRL